MDTNNALKRMQHKVSSLPGFTRPAGVQETDGIGINGVFDDDEVWKHQSDVAICPHSHAAQFVSHDQRPTAACDGRSDIGHPLLENRLQLVDDIIGNRLCRLPDRL